jgi:SSS family solute:Na+ symporter
MIFLVPGLIGYALHQKGVEGFAIPTEDGVIKGDMVFPTMVASLLPVGLRGLVVGGLLAALMSSLSSLFNSCSALFTIDIYKKLHPTASEKMLVHVGRLATGVIVVLGLLWIPIMPLIAKGGLYKYLQSVQGYLAPPITAVFLLGLFCKRINAKGAVAGLVIGFIAGMAKLVIQGMAGANMFTEGTMLYNIGNYNFLYASGWLMAISVLVIVAVSLLTKPPSLEQIKNLTYSTATEEQRKENRESWNKWDVIATVVVLSLVLGMYLYFSFWLN